MIYEYYLRSFSDERYVNEWLKNNKDWEPFLMTQGEGHYTVNIMFRKPV